MEGNEELAQEALRYLSLAQKFENEKDLEKAVESYELAASYLKNSGFLIDKISDIYSRIEELKDFAKQEMIYDQTSAKNQLEQLQDQAFSLLDGAQKLEADGFLEDAIEQYKAAIKLLIQTGWSETQLSNLQSKLMTLSDNLKHHRAVTKAQIGEVQEKEYLQKEIEPQIVSAFGVTKSAAKTEELKKLRETKQREQEIQNEAFQFIDNAKFFETDKNFDKAIENYQNAVNLLNSIGWHDQTNSINIIIEKLKNDKKEYEQFRTQKQSEIIFSKELTDEYEGVRSKVYRDEEKIQIEAFNLVDFGKKLEREKKYDQAVNKFQNAIELFKSIEWDSYIQPVINFIKNIENKQAWEKEKNTTRQKRDDQLKNLQDTIYFKEKDEIIETARELDKNRLEYEQKRKENLRKEEKLFTILNDADRILKEESDYTKAINRYTEALEYLKELGKDWKSHTPTIEETILSIKKLEENKIEKELERQTRQDQRRKSDFEFQQLTSIELAKEREKIRLREGILHEKREELEQLENRKADAFKALNEAENFVKNVELDSAIAAYQKAGNIFASIHWNDELHLIENSIRELENRKREHLLAKQTDMAKSIEEFKVEQQFQEQVSKQHQIERESLKKKKILLRDQKTELIYREKKKDEAFKILEDAHVYLEKGDFDKTIEIYQQVTSIFAEIQWYDEMERIGNAIIEIENKKREANLKKQRDMEILIKKEREDREFQQKIIEEMNIKRKKLEQRDIIKKERENEINFREKQKEEAFKILDEAQNYLSLGEFDLAIESYRNINQIFAQIQWIEEIVLMNQTINKIENEKKQLEIRKQRDFEKLIKEDTEHRQFLINLKIQREREKILIQSEREILETRKEMSSQNILKQQEAFKIIEDADRFLAQENYIKAIEVYQNALNTLKQIGWTGKYVLLLEESIRNLQFRKDEKERQKLLEKEKVRKQAEEEIDFERKVSENFQQEREKMLSKKIELLKREDMKKLMETKKLEAFSMMDRAEHLLNQGKYEESIENYYKAELILIQIQFPTEMIKNTILKIQEKKREANITKQQELENVISKQEEEKHFLQTIADNMKFEEEQMKVKQIKIKKQEDLKLHLEKRKEAAFELLDEAEVYIKRADYDNALEYYRSAELVLSEINYPTNSIKELIVQFKEKQRANEFQKQKALEQKLQKEREEIDFQKKVAKNLSIERERLKLKKVEDEKLILTQALIESKKDEAFNILDDAELHINNSDFELAIMSYRKAMLILNEINFPIDSISDMITKAEVLKKRREQEEEQKLKRELERLKEEVNLEGILKKRRHQEREKKKAQQIAAKQRERIIQDQLTFREAAYSLLEDGGKYIKMSTPDYDKAVSLYIQARDLLAEKIGWEPEITNLNTLIKDLIHEKEFHLEKKKAEEEASIKRQQEYELFREEMRKQQMETELRKREQQKKLKNLYETQKKSEKIKEEGLKLIDEGKELANKYDFTVAYKKFNAAITKFKEIGWSEQLKFIQKEIDNARKFEEKVNESNRKIKKIHQELENQKLIDARKKKEETQKIEGTIKEVSVLAGEVSNLIKIKKKKEELQSQQRREKVVSKSKEFRMDMQKLLNLKQELTQELSESKKSIENKKKQAELAKDKEKADEIKKMLKDISKNK
jgi:tetratricopeptide (TPR) repeat protein